MRFHELKAGQKIKFRQYAGLGRNGPEYKDAVAKVVQYLVFEDHVIVYVKGRAQVVNDSNFLEV
jgi:hypothetical protein